MEAAACLLAPVIGDVLAVLSAAPGCRLARMSGSGATCFALFKDCRSAARAKKAILQAHPEWWVKAGFWVKGGGLRLSSFCGGGTPLAFTGIQP